MKVSIVAYLHLFLSTTAAVSAFSITRPFTSTSTSTKTSSPAFLVSNENENGVRFSSSSSFTSLNMAGFGGGGGMSKKGGKKKGSKKKGSSGGGAGIKLKPKPQWDRYGKLKKATAVRVGVRVANDGDGDDAEKGEWFEVGKVKSEENNFTEIAVAMQRGIIAEHAKRLYPLQILPKDKVEWGYASADSPTQEDWATVDKSVAADVAPGTEKKVGFEGKPDAGTGFYCHYQDGRLVDRYDESKSLAKE